MESSVGMMTFPTEWENNSSSKPPTRITGIYKGSTTKITVHRPGTTWWTRQGGLWFDPSPNDDHPPTMAHWRWIFIGSIPMFNCFGLEKASCLMLFHSQDMTLRSDEFVSEWLRKTARGGLTQHILQAAEAKLATLGNPMVFTWLAKLLSWFMILQSLLGLW